MSEPLTSRETAVLTLMGCGYANTGIGHKLGLSESTVKNYVSGILTKLDCHSRTSAVVKGLQQGILVLDQLKEEV
jgi:DNA-binding NarL/FixJ family response regulator